LELLFIVNCKNLPYKKYLPINKKNPDIWKYSKDLEKDLVPVKKKGPKRIKLFDLLLLIIKFFLLDK